MRRWHWRYKEYGYDRIGDWGSPVPSGCRSR
jgi:hypothetical protein